MNKKVCLYAGYLPIFQATSLELQVRALFKKEKLEPEKVAQDATPNIFPEAA